MDRKSFIAVAVFVVVTFLATAAVKYGQPVAATDISFDSFPLKKGNWTGQRYEIPSYVTELLNPIDIFSGAYANSSGEQVHLLFDFFSNTGGPHSPLNCLPGAGWSIKGDVPREIHLESRTFKCYRFQLEKNGNSFVMDFWYVTPFGETANDFVFKLHELGTSLAFLPRNVAFIRIVAAKNPTSLAALEEFEMLFIPEIYSRLPFDH